VGFLRDDEEGEIAMPEKHEKSLGIRFIAYFLLTAGGVVIAIPLVWMVATSLKDWMQLPQPLGGVAKGGFVYFTNLGLLWRDFFPNPVKFVNYPDALSSFPFFLYLKNTLVITILTIVGTVFSNSLVAYAFARLRFPGKNVIFLVYIATMLIPAAGGIIPSYILWAKVFHAINTYVPLVAPAFFAAPFSVFLMRQFFLTVPAEMEDSARIDGCGEFTIYARIMLPLLGPVIATLVIFSFMGSWNDFFGPLIYINSQSKWTLSLALAMFARQMSSQLSTNAQNYQMVVAVVMTIPMLLVFYFSQRAIVKGIVLTGMTR
jgi:ABC-type glycerol-3-phosphate transport system permease component